MLERAFDLAVAVMVLIIGSPLLLAVAIAVKMTSRGPIFFRGLRAGKNGAPFRILKFRTMRETRGEGQPRITVAADPRITPVGRFLRRTKLDELPQLVNVLRGEMSIVGPRPEDQHYVELYSPEQRAVLGVRPGLTSPASLVYRDEESLLTGAEWEARYRTEILPDKLRIDLEYLSDRTFAKDIRVILKTIGSILR